MIYVMSGGGKLTTVIAVTYPAGSVCTCGGKKANDTSGYALFNVRAGTYTVECRTGDNSQSKSVAVTITESDKGKAIGVTLSYRVFAFSANDQHTEITGGWEAAADSGGYTTEIGETLSLPSCAATGKGAYIATKNMIDLTNYSKIRFNGYAEDPNYAAFGVSKTLKTGMGYDGPSYYTACVRPSTSKSDHYLDVSSLTGAYYISVSAYRGTSAYAKAYAYEIELIE